MDAFVILKALIALPIIFFIPGFVTFYALKANKIKSLKLSLFETLFLQILASIVITGWIAFTLAEAGHFSLWALYGSLLAYSLVIAIIFRDRFRDFTFPRPVWNRQSAFIILLAILAGFLFFHPSEAITCLDSVNLANSGANIARTGSMLIYDPILTDMNEEMRAVFYQLDFQQIHSYYGLQFPGQGFYIFDDTADKISPQYLQMYPTWLAIFYSLFGFANGLYITSIFGLLSILALFLVAKAFWGLRTGAIASFLLTVSFLQIYFSRLPTAEMLFQLLFFGGIFSFVMFYKTSHRFFAIISALCLGELLLTRLDALILLLCIVGFFIFLKVANRLNRGYLFFIIPFLLVAIHSFLYYVHISYPYLSDQFISLRNVWNLFSDLHVYFWYFLIVLVIGAVFILLALRVLHFGTQAKASAPRGFLIESAGKLKGLLIVCLIFLIIYAYWTEPTTGYGIGGNNFITLGWYISDLGVGLALIGLLSVIHRKSKTEVEIFFLALCLLFTFIFLFNIFNQPLYPWSMRRYIPVVLPFFFILVGIILADISRFVRIGKYVAIAAALSLVTFSFVVYGSSLGFREYENVVEQTEEFSTYFEDTSVIVFHQEWIPGRLSISLKHMFGKNTIQLPEENLVNMNEYLKQYNQWNNEGRTIYLVNPTPEFIDLMPLELTSVGEYTLTMQRFLLSVNSAGTAIQTRDLHFAVYKVVVD